MAVTVNGDPRIIQVLVSGGRLVGLDEFGDIWASTLGVVDKDHGPFRWVFLKHYFEEVGEEGLGDTDTTQTGGTQGLD